MNAQGEDVVAGVRTPQKIEELGREIPEAISLEDVAKKLKTLQRYAGYGVPIENKKLYMLQTRNGKRTATGCTP